MEEGVQRSVVGQPFWIRFVVFILMFEWVSGGFGLGLGLVAVLISYIVLSLCMNFLMSWCRFCMFKCFGLGTKVNPFLSKVF